MEKPVIEESFTDNGEHDYYNLINSSTGELLWSEEPEEEFSKNHRRPKNRD